MARPNATADDEVSDVDDDFVDEGDGDFQDEWEGEWCQDVFVSN